MNLPLREGWNHLVLQFDTTTEPGSLRFKLNTPKGVEHIICSATRPQELGDPPASGNTAAYVSECMLAGPYPGEPDLGVYIRLADDRDPGAALVDVAARGTLVTLEGAFVQFRGFEVRHGGQFQQRAQVSLFGEGSVIEGCLIRDSEVSAISFRSILTDEAGRPLVILHQNAAPTVIRNNWVVNPGNVGISGSCDSEFLTAENQDNAAPGRSPFLIEHNVLVNPNWTGIKPFWASGGMKLFKLTGTVIRYNTIVGGTGPGIWLDWEHYGNRLEGNLGRNGWSMLIGVEASPGPNLLANNVCIDLRPGEVWFRWALLSWSSGRNWAVNNTIDGRWNATPAWQNKTGGDGLNLGCQGDDRGTRWGALPDRVNVHMNNVIVGCKRAILNRKDAFGVSDSIDRNSDINAANFTDRGTGAEPIVPPPVFRNPEAGDSRPVQGSTLNHAGARGNQYTGLVRHDFHGLLRFDDDSRSVGAFRFEPEYRSATQIVHDLVDAVSKNGCLLLGVCPSPQGEIPQGQRDRLLSIGEWLSVNGEAIYGTRPWHMYGDGPTEVVVGVFQEAKTKPFTARDIRSTRSDDALYVIALGWPEDGEIAIAPLGTARDSTPVERVDLLGHDGPLRYERTAAALTVQLPANRPCEHAVTLKVVRDVVVE